MLLSQKVGRSSQAVPDLVHEYLKFTFLRERLEGVLTLNPSVLVDDVWRAHITCERYLGSLGLSRRNIMARDVSPVYTFDIFEEDFDYRNPNT